VLRTSGSARNLFLDLMAGNLANFRDLGRKTCLRGTLLAPVPQNCRKKCSTSAGRAAAKNCHHAARNIRYLLLHASHRPERTTRHVVF
jgi:hypothetical protein